MSDSRTVLQNEGHFTILDFCPPGVEKVPASWEELVDIYEAKNEKEDTKKEDTKKEDTKKEDTKKEDTKKEDTKKEDTKKQVQESAPLKDCSTTKENRASRKNRGWSTVEKKQPRPKTRKEKPSLSKTSLPKPSLPKPSLSKPSLSKTSVSKTSQMDSSSEEDSETENTVILKNLPYRDTYVIDLLIRLEIHGTIRNIRVLRTKDRRCKGIAFIEFENKEGADRAVESDHFKYENRRVSINYAK